MDLEFKSSSDSLQSPLSPDDEVDFFTSKRNDEWDRYLPSKRERRKGIKGGECI